jgi:hypothetical protein
MIGQDAAKNRLCWLLLALAAGFIASVPFAPPTDANRMRFYAATIATVAIFPALALAPLLKRDKRCGWLSADYLPGQASVSRPDEDTRKRRQESNTISSLGGEEPPAACWAALALAVCIFIAPVFFKLRTPAPVTPADQISCPSGMQSAEIEFHCGTSLQIEKEHVLFLDWVPRLHESRFEKNLHSVGAQNLIEGFYELEAPLTLFPAIDYTAWESNRGRSAWFIINHQQLPITSLVKPGRSSRLRLCGYETRRGAFRFFFVTQVLEPTGK